MTFFLLLATPFQAFQEATLVALRFGSFVSYPPGRGHTCRGFRGGFRGRFRFLSWRGFSIRLATIFCFSLGMVIDRSEIRLSS